MQAKVLATIPIDGNNVDDHGYDQVRYSYGVEVDALGKGKAKGEGKGPKGGCFECGGEHYASECAVLGRAQTKQIDT